jgi:hypothetical protein
MSKVVSWVDAQDRRVCHPQTSPRVTPHTRKLFFDFRGFCRAISRRARPDRDRRQRQLKIVRALAAQPTFAQGLVYAPVRDWSQMVIDEMEVFPKGRYDDLTDSTTMAVSFLRTSGILQTDAEAMAAEANTVTHRPRRLRALYPC